MSNHQHTQLFRFLKDYYQLKERSVYDVNNSTKYLSVLPLDTFAGVDETRSRLLGHADEEDDRLLRLKRPGTPPERPVPVTPSSELVAWLEGVTDNHEITPVLRRRIARETQLEGEDHGGWWNLVDFPRIAEQAERYLLAHEKWREEMRAWKPLHEAHQRHLQLYNKLFEAQRRTEIYAERFELLLGLGLVLWNDGKRPYRRPIVVVPLEATLTPTGTVELRLAAEVNLFRVENDFLSGGDLDATGATGALLKELGDGAGEFWDTYDRQLERALGAFAAKLSATARYVGGAPTGQMPTVPTLHHAPVVMLRERSQRSFSVLFDNILKELRENTDRQLRLLDRIVLPHELFLEQYPASAKEQRRTPVEEIFLPKESNDEQLQIAEQIEYQDLLVVQGPPGTGKSHTIANVITHLLARGKKVLVTAKTDQALRALQEHVPPVFHDLMIYFLQGADKSGEELVRSVSRLQDLVETHDRATMARLAATHHAELKDLRRNRAALLNQIQELRDADVRPADFNAGYRDQPLADHVTRVLEEAPRHEWMQAEVVTSLEEQLAAAPDLEEWFSQYANETVRAFQPDARVMLDVPLLPAPAKITELGKLARELEINFPAGTWTISPEVSGEEAHACIDDFLKLPKLSVRQAWQQDLWRDLEAGNTDGWQRRLKTTVENIGVLAPPEVAVLYREVEFDIPPGVSPKKLRADVLEVGNYFRTGKALTGLMSKFQLTKAVKDRAYVYQACTLNGHPAITAAALEKLYLHAQVCCALEELAAAWHHYPTDAGRVADQRIEYIDRLQQLQHFLQDYPLYHQARTRVQRMVGRAAADLEALDAAQKLRTALAAHAARGTIGALAREIRMAEAYLNRFAPRDQASKELLEAIQRRDAEAYASGLADFKALTELNRRHEALQRATVRGQRSYPATMAAWVSALNKPVPTTAAILAAIYWRNAAEQLSGRFSESIDDLFDRIRRNDQRFREVALEYVRIKATASFVEGLKNVNAFNSTLVRWMQAAKSSSGRGKKAFQARIAAKEKLREISSDIPCWIMPLYRLADTLTPTPELFDVVIIDEASQLGPEASFLQYITKKIIVVGDDQQTAPEEVGVEEDMVQGLIRAYLGDIRDRQYYGTNYTFFDHAAANAGRRITLREHFRCMPEIIGFSNELCYAPLGTALIPLKQFRGDRLPPLQTHFVPNGTFSRDENEPEAEAIVARIQAIMADPVYDGKTIGVITLQGDKQYRAIERLLEKAAENKGFGEERTARRLEVGRPADFQGDERDIILLSLVTALDHRRNSVTTDNYKRRYNVAMSRAKEQVVLFHSVRLEDLKPNDLRYKLLHYFTKGSLGETLGVEVIPSGPRDIPPGQPFDSWFEVDVYRDLTEAGYIVQPQYQVGAYRIDLVVHLENGSRIAVECDGDRWHGPEHIEQDTIRQLQLERSGWEFYRIRYSQYMYDKASALDALWGLLKARGEVKPQAIIQMPDIFTSNPDNTTADITPIAEEVIKSETYSAVPFTEPSIAPIETHVSADGLFTRLVFTSNARFFRFSVPTEDHLVYPSFKRGEKAVFQLTTQNYEGHMIFGYENGKVDKVELKGFKGKRQISQRAYSLDSRLIYIQHFFTDENMVGITDEKKVIAFNTRIITEHNTRGGMGNQLFVKGSRMIRLKLLTEAKLADPGYYMKKSKNIAGYYLKPGDIV